MPEMDPLVGFHFVLMFGGKAAGAFNECSGIGSENEVVEHKAVVDGKEYIKKIPGRMKYQDVTLKRGVTDAMDLWQWRKLVEQGNVTSARTDCSVIMQDTTGKDVARWDFLRAWPTKITGPSAKSDDNAISVEEVTFAHEGMTRVS